jgi:hypothetical protein
MIVGNDHTSNDTATESPRHSWSTCPLPWATTSPWPRHPLTMTRVLSSYFCGEMSVRFVAAIVKLYGASIDEQGSRRLIGESAR